ncbi:MAG: hypothetical protein KKB31_00470 [Nanoarchaeota archaeon]|nr:hypothetical protein [Nanoarchaeota archaeon]
MPSKQSHSANAKELGERVASGQLQTYFKTLPRGEASLLAKALQKDEFADISTILVRNLSSYGQSLEIALISAYEDQVKQLAERLIDERVEDLEEDIDKAVESRDFDRINRFADELEKLSPVSDRSKRVIEKLKRIAIKVRVPFSLKARVRKFSKEKDFEIDRTTKAGVYESWSNKKPAFAVFHNGKIVTWHNITPKQYEKFKKAKKVKIEYKPTTSRRIKETPKIVSLGRAPLSNKEKIFIRSRSDMGVGDVYSDYLKKFGKIRPKGNLLKEIRRLSSS